MNRPNNPAQALLARFRPQLSGLLRQPSIVKAADDHWDGQHFHNTHNAQPHGISQALRWMASRRPAAWPTALPERARAIPPAQLSDSINDIQVTFVNHATVLLQIGSWNLLTDPVWSDYCSPVQGVGPRRVCRPGIELTDLPTIHAVLLSHDHYDHLDMRTLLWLHQRDAPLIITGLGVEACLQAEGIHTVCALDWWQSLTLGPLHIHFLPAQHFSGRGARDRNRTLWGSLWVQAGESSVYFAGDTGYGPHFGEIRARMGSPSLALLPIGAYAPRWFMKPVHMDPADAVLAHLDLGAEQSLAIHFNTFQLTDEAIDAPVQALTAELESKGIAPEHFRVLGEGDSWRL